MYFSRVRLDPMSLQCSDIIKTLRSSVYREHQLIWDLFENEEDTKRDFLYRRFDDKGLPQFFVLSHRKPNAVKPIWEVDTTEYNPRINMGDIYSFQLRVNPVVTKKIEGSKNPKSRKHDDVVMETRAKYKKLGKEMPSNNEIVIESGLKWINGKADTLGCHMDPKKVIVEGYSRRTGNKDKSGHQIRLGIMDFSGILRVTHPENFRKALTNGIGRAKAFGCGLLLLKRL